MGFSSDAAAAAAAFDAITHLRRRGESGLEAARRILVAESLRRSHGVQKYAAELLGVTARMMNYYARGSFDPKSGEWRPALVTPDMLWDKRRRP